MSLTSYRKKRSFSRTPEPEGKAIEKINKQLEFVVQEHHATHLHYDFRLELNGVLKSWAVPKGPSMDPHEKHLAVMVEDHPYEYRNFEGIIPKGNYGAGKVTIWDKGTYEPLELTDNPEKLLSNELAKGDLKFILHGKKLHGEFALVKFGKEEKNWLLVKKNESLNTPRLPTKNTPMPHHIAPMLSTFADKPFNDADWIFEQKWDGYRIIAEKKNTNVQLLSRNNQNYTQLYTEIAGELSRIPDDFILDGEVVAVDQHGTAKFQYLQDYLQHKNKRTLFYFIFDIMYFRGKDLRNLPLTERKQILQKYITESAHVKISDYIENEGMKLFDLARKHNTEGIMAKRKDSTYVSKRTDAWLKIKNLHMQEAIICGFTQPKGNREAFGALILGVYENNHLVYVGHTGSGFTDKSLQEVFQKLKPLIQKKCPFAIIPPTNDVATWVRPEKVCEIKFSEWTKDGVMRQPIFLGLRDDKNARDIVKEETAHGFGTGKNNEEIDNVVITNSDKIFWKKEKYTKGDVISYYEKIAHVLLPYIKDRPQSLNRFPNGIEGESFFQKNITDAPSWVKTVEIFSESEGKTIRWLICNDKKTLLYMANLGCIEINPWNSRIDKKEFPDYLIIDLDPHGLLFSHAVTAAKMVKQIMDKADIDCFVKTSGKKGLHILVPLGAKYTYAQTRQFAELLARIVADKLPTTTSVVREPEKREKKVYIDFLQNKLGATLAAPYCIRPVAHAPVSTPLKWKELTSKLSPENFTIKNIFSRLSRKGDIWKPFLSHNGIDMKKSIDLLEKYFLT